MKKLLSLLMAAMMLALTPALAESAATQTLTSPDGTYTIGVPADYIVINDDLVAALEADEAELERILAGISLNDLAALKNLVAEDKASNSVRADSPDFLFNLIVSASPLPASMEQWIARKSMMDDLYISQYTAAGIPEEMIQTMDILEIGGWRWYGLDIGVPGFQFRQRMTIHDGTLYLFNFADGGSNADMTIAILESFTLVTD